MSDNISEHPSEYDPSVLNKSRSRIISNNKFAMQPSKLDLSDTSNDPADFSEFGEQKCQPERDMMDQAMRENNKLSPLPESQTTYYHEHMASPYDQKPSTHKKKNSENTMQKYPSRNHLAIGFTNTN
jgi:hypothetical protein